MKRHLYAAIFFVLLTIFLIAAHYVKGYSDPVGFLFLAEKMAEGNPVTSRALVYPAMLALLLKLLGRSYVFLSNLPFILLLFWTLYQLTRITLSSDGREKPTDRLVVTATFLAVCGFTWANRLFVLEILNPFREPLAFSFLLGGLCILLSSRNSLSPLHLIGAGVFIGLATSTRETCILILPPVGLWVLLGRSQCRWRNRILGGLLLGVGLGMGMTPTFIGNHLQSGNVAVPSYAAEKLETLVENKSWDIPIPGMSIHYFKQTGFNSLRDIQRKYTWWGLAIIAIGAAAAIRHRNRALLCILIPSILLHLLFYSFYSYAKNRYLFVIDLFTTPVMAYGIYTMAKTLLPRIPLHLRSLSYHLTCSLALAAVAVSLWQIHLTTQHRFKVWQIDDFQEAVRPHLKSPYTFLGHRHFSFMFKWFLGGETKEFIRETNYGNQALKGKTYEETYRQIGENLIAEIQTGNFYMYEGQPPHFRNWFDHAPVLSFAELPVSVTRYGKPLTESLYQVTTWKTEHLKETLPWDHPAPPKLLVIDLGRPWDYPNRTTCELFVNDLQLGAVSNHVQFFELPANLVTNSARIEIRSDAALPQNPYLKLHALNKPLRFDFGMGHRPNFNSQCSDELHQFKPFKANAGTLFDSGTIYVPTLAATNYRTLAVLRTEFYQEDPFFSKTSHNITVTAGGVARTESLPPRKTTKTYTHDLGKGGGGLTITPLHITTTLPSLTEQQTLIQKGVIFDDFGFVKLYSVTLLPILDILYEELTIDIGGDLDLPYIKDGFFDRETHAGGLHLRWTSGQASILMPMKAGQEKYQIEIYCQNTRPDAYAKPPTFSLNTTPLDFSEKVTENGQQTIYHLKVPANLVKKDEADELEITVPTWSPKDVFGTTDGRELGLLIDTIQFRATE